MRAGGLRPWGLAVALVWASLAWAQAPSREARGQVVDRVVAVVDGELVSLLDLEFEASIFLIQRGAQRVATESIDEGMLGRVLDLAINQRLITRDADKLQTYPVDEAELEAKVKAFEARFEGRPAFERYLERFEATRAMLGEVLRREMRAERVLDNKVRLRAQVGEEEIRQYYEAHQGELGANYEAIRQAVREKLTAERYTRLVVAEVAQLRRKATIRLAGPFAPAKEAR